MSLSIAFQMDKNVNFRNDTTVTLMQEAQKRGYEIFFYTPNDLSLKNNEPIASAKRVIACDSDFNFSEDEVIPLNKMHIIFVRQNPPFDMRYITTTYILEKVNALIINNPTEIRNCPEKLLVSHFPQFTLPTLITEDLAAIKSFYLEHKDVILKPLYSYGGNDVLRINHNDINIEVISQIMVEKYDCPIIVQLFCNDINSDKRVLLLDGEPIGAIRRVPNSNEEIRTNIRLGASVEKVSLNDRDHNICTVVGLELRKRGLLFAAIDIIGDYLLEINVTSPTGVVEVNELYGLSLEKTIWDCFEEKVQKN
ncbi:glutathione synthase [Candidatus Mesenet endosymbiont of Phosphuga atrata]|uniref:glutathione synthase n=1 Tax=Candidatus Mesenet endosymbiont of Phosphuga atrata TaxID=3066221 RepID=UPI0030D5E2AE